MTDDALVAALRDMGVADPEAFAGTLERKLRERGYGVTFDSARYYAQMKAERERALKDEKQAALDAALPYSGAIHDCQVSVPDGGRSVRDHRCTRRARFVVRVSRDRAPGDGRLAVCRTHTYRPSRFIGSSSWDRSADEVVEKEYQP